MGVTTESRYDKGTDEIPRFFEHSLLLTTGVKSAKGKSLGQDWKNKVRFSRKLGIKNPLLFEEPFYTSIQKSEDRSGEGE